MKWVFRTWGFGIAMVLGVCSAAFVDMLTFEPRAVSIEEFERSREMPDTPINGTGVRVTYIGWETGPPESFSYLKFMVHNDSWEPLSYWGHNSNDMLVELRSNGKEMQLTGRCGTGMRSHLLLPGESAIVNVSGFEFRTRPSQHDLITAGFPLRRPFGEEFTVYWSEPITLSEEFRIAIEAR